MSKKQQEQQPENEPREATEEELRRLVPFMDDVLEDGVPVPPMEMEEQDAR